MIGTMKLVSSYPRSGSSWFRFIVCNLYYPEQVHDFESVNHLFPGVDTALACIEVPKWGKTHELHKVDVFLYRHVGDVLISQYWYNKKYEPDFNMSMREWFFADDFGQGWRDHVNFYKDHPNKLGYDQLKKADQISRVLDGVDSLFKLRMAMENSSFSEMQLIEHKGFGVYPTGDASIKFVREGKTGQWNDLEDELRFALLEKNKDELIMLGLLDDEPEKKLKNKKMSEYYKTIPGEMCDFHAYYDKVAARLPNKSKVIEVGVADGHSAIYLAEKLQSMGKDFEMIMVDSMDYGGEEQYINILTNIIQAGLKDRIKIYKLDSLVASCRIVDNSANFVFIDASHKYPETMADCRLWWQKVHPKGGILAGHDMTSDENPEVSQAINEVFSPEYVKIIETEKGLGVWEVQRTPGAFQLSTFA